MQIDLKMMLPQKLWNAAQAPLGNWWRQYQGKLVKAYGSLHRCDHERVASSFRKQRHDIP